MAARRLIQLALPLGLVAAALPACGGMDEEPVEPPAASSAELRRGLPEALWQHRSVLFPPDAPLPIAETRDYRPPPAWQDATRDHAGSVTLGPEGRLDGHVAGTPFPASGIDCLGDPNAGTKLAWNFAHRWRGDGGRGALRVTWWDRGERLGDPLEADWALFRLLHRVEPRFLGPRGGALFHSETRSEVLVIEVSAPFEDRGTRVVRYRYAVPASKHDNLWVYVPEWRRVRRLVASQWSTAVPGTDLVLEDIGGLGSRVAAHRWTCLGERTLLAAMRDRARPAPAQDEAHPDAAGLALTKAVFERRAALRVRAAPRDPDHPYAHKDLWLDRETFEPLYFLAYDRRGTLLRVGVRVSAWSGDDRAAYPGWEEVPEPRDLFGVSWSVANVQLETGVRWEWAAYTGTPLPSLGRVRRWTSITGRCVAAGTAIATERGARAVETLRVGDRLWSWDPETGRRVLATVAAVSRATASETLRLEGGLRVTPDHPVFADGGFHPAAALGAGSALLADDGSPQPAGRIERLLGEIDVYDLSVGWPHTYFAGGVLVHNKKSR